MGTADVAVWGQAQVPATATAVFPPDSVPASPPANYTRATLHYLDVEGRSVNTIEPGVSGNSMLPASAVGGC